jgi:hypothetical protein
LPHSPSDRGSGGKAFVTVFPRNAMGKVQKALLRERFPSDTSSAKDA